MAGWLGFFSGDSSAAALKTIENRLVGGTASQKNLVETHKILMAALRSDDAETASRAVDVLKTAYGTSLFGEEENILLKQAFSCALEKQYFSIAGYILEAYRPLFRATKSCVVQKRIVQDISLLAVLAMRRNCNALASTAISILTYLSLRAEDELAGELVDALRVIGMETIRQKDGGLLLELSRSMAQVNLFIGERSQQAWLRLLENWLAAMNDNPFATMGEGFLPALTAAETGLADVGWADWMQTWGTLLRQQILRPRWKGSECLWTAFFQSMERMPAQQAGMALSHVMAGMLILLQQEGFPAVMTWYLPLFTQGGLWLLEEERFSNWESGHSRRFLLERIRREMLMFAKAAARNDFTKGENDFFIEWGDMIPAGAQAGAVKRFFQWMQA